MPVSLTLGFFSATLYIKPKNPQVFHRICLFEFKEKLSMAVFFPRLFLTHRNFTSFYNFIELLPLLKTLFLSFLWCTYDLPSIYLRWSLRPFRPLCALEVEGGSRRSFKEQIIVGGWCYHLPPKLKTIDIIQRELRFFGTDWHAHRFPVTF